MAALSSHGWGHRSPRAPGSGGPRVWPLTTWQNPKAERWVMVKRERNEFSEANTPKTEASCLKDCHQSAENTPWFIDGRCGPEVSGYVQVGSDSQVIAVLGSIVGRVLLAQGRPYHLRGPIPFPVPEALPAGSLAWIKRWAAKKNLLS